MTETGHLKWQFESWESIMRNTNNATPQNSSYGTHELRGALFDYGWRYECIGNFQETNYCSNA